MAFSPLILASVLAQGAAGYQAGAAQAQARQDTLDQQGQQQRNWAAAHDLAVKSEADQMTDAEAQRQAAREAQQAGFGQQERMSNLDFGHSSDLSDQGYQQSLGLQASGADIAADASQRDYSRDLSKMGYGMLANEPAFQTALGEVPSAEQQQHVLATRQGVINSLMGKNVIQEPTLRPGTTAPLSLDAQAKAAEIGHMRFNDQLAGRQFSYKQQADRSDLQLEQQKLTENKRQFGAQMALGWAKQNLEYKHTMAEITALQAKGAADPGVVQHYSGVAANYGTQATALSNAANAMEEQARTWAAKAQGQGQKADDDGKLLPIDDGLAMIYRRNAEQSQKRADNLRSQASDALAKQDQLVGMLTGRAATTAAPGTAPTAPAKPSVAGGWIKAGKSPVSYRVIGK